MGHHHRVVGSLREDGLTEEPVATRGNCRNHPSWQGPGRVNGHNLPEDCQKVSALLRHSPWRWPSGVVQCHIDPVQCRSERVQWRIGSVQCRKAFLECRSVGPSALLADLQCRRSLCQRLNGLMPRHEAGGVCDDASAHCRDTIPPCAVVGALCDLVRLRAGIELVLATNGRHSRLNEVEKRSAECLQCREVPVQPQDSRSIEAWLEYNCDTPWRVATQRR